MGDINITAGSNASIGELVSGNKIVRAPEPLALNLHQLPAPPRDFTGRKAELKELMAAVEKGGATISGVHGLGGIGKTALALKLAEALIERYPDAQYYLDLRGAHEQKPLTPAEAMAHIVRAHHPTAKLPESETELSALYRTVLNGQRALLLMDNAKDAEQVRPLIPPATCCLLITSRQHFTLPGLVSKNLEQLRPKDARKLLLTIARRIGKQADELAELCGYLPLALRLTASLLAERADLTPADLLQRLQDTQKRLALTGADASLQLSYDLLTEAQQWRWRALSVFPDTFDRAAGQAVWALEEEAAVDGLGELVKFSLLDFTPTPALPHLKKAQMGEGEVRPSPVGELSDGGGVGGGGRYHLHDLARLFAAAHLSEAERDTAQKRHALHYAEVIGDAQQLYRKGDSFKAGLALFDLEWPNIQRGQAWALAHMEGEEAVKATNWYAWQWDLLYLRLHPRDQIRWAEGGLRAAHQLKNHQAEGAHLGNLGLSYADLGDARKAIELFEQYLAIAHEIGDQRGEGNALNNLGVAHAALGNTRKAIELFEQHFEIARDIGDRRGEANALTNTGNTHRNLGDARTAIEYHIQALSAFSAIADQRGKGIALGNLGNAYADLGDARKAIEFYKQQLATAREIGDQRSESNAMFNMSLALNTLGQRAPAIANAVAALKIYEALEDSWAEKVRKKLAEWRSAGEE